MSGPSTNPENELSSTLARQAEQFARRGGSDLGLDQVVSRAGEIRRGRRMRATMVMAAVVLAVAVPVGVTVLNDPTKPSEIVPADPSDNSAITLDELERGSYPKFGFVSRGHYNLPDGEFQIDGVEPSAVASAGSGLMLTTTDNSGNRRVHYVDLEDGTTTKSWPIDGDVAVSEDGALAAFTQPDGTVTVVQDRGTRDYDLGRIPTGSGFDTVSINGENCSGSSETDTCGVVVVSRGEKPQTWLIGPNAGPGTIYPRLISYIGTTKIKGLTGGLVSATDDGSCSEVLDHDDEPLWNTCKYKFLQFSPDGKYLLATNADGDGFGDTSLTVLDAETGEVKLDLRTGERAAIPAMQWEDDDHVLAVVSDQQRWSVQRISLDGSREYAVQPESGSDDLNAPFILVTH